LDDAKAKSAVAQQVLPLINDVGDPVEREHYRQQLARALRTDERTLRLVQLPSAAPRQSSTPPPPPPPDDESFYEGNGAHQKARRTRPSAVSDKRAANLLRQCLEYPRLIVQVNQTLLRQEQAALNKGDLALPEDRLILAIIYDRADQSPVVTIEELCDSLDAVLLERIETLMVLPASPESELSRLPDRLAMSVLDWRLVQARAEVEQLQQLSREVHAQPDEAASMAHLYGPRILELQVKIKWINKAKDAISASGQRRAEQGIGR